MELDDDLRGFDQTCRLFPLPNVVLFPHAVLPLHIFEPRYRQMTADALATDRLVAMVQISPGHDWKLQVDPAIEPIACLGKILEYEQLPDGKYNFLLVGKARLRLLEELPKTKLYRQARVEIMEDTVPDFSVDPLRAELVELFRRVTEFSKTLDSEMEVLLDSSISLGALTDIIAHSLGLPSNLKQTMLTETRVDRRAVGLIGILRELAKIAQKGVRIQDDRTFPPPFSNN